MKITFLGATRRVTGSSYLVEGAGKKFLVDCGLYQGGAEEDLLNESSFEFDIKEIDFVLLTHAHIDHSGRIPKLYKQGYRKPVYATKATCDLCSIMLPDSGYIQENEAEIKNKKLKRLGKKNLVDPLYTEKDARESIRLFSEIYYDQIMDVAENIQVRYNDAGHMLGSAMIEVWITECDQIQKIVFSGDIGNNEISMLSQPTMIGDTDYLVMESTYGNRIHKRNEEKAATFLKIVYETLDNGGTVVIPSFAVGRTQEILYELDKLKDRYRDDAEFQKRYEKLMQTPVYVDSPLAISATEIFKKNMELFSDEIQESLKKGDNPLEFDGLKFTKSVEESKRLNESTEPCIIISASGMCDVGRIKHHLKHHLWNAMDTILFVGYQAPGTLGRRIVEGQKRVKIFGEEISVEARIEYIEGYSGHADQEGLMNYVYSFKNKMPKNIFLVHGEIDSQTELKNKIDEELNINTIIPKYGETYELKTDEFKVCEENKINIEKQVSRLELIEKMQDLEKELKEMKNQLIADIENEENSNEEISKLNTKVNEFRSHIIELMNKE